MSSDDSDDDTPAARDWKFRRDMRETITRTVNDNLSNPVERRWLEQWPAEEWTKVIVDALLPRDFDEAGGDPEWRQFHEQVVSDILKRRAMS